MIDSIYWRITNGDDTTIVHLVAKATLDECIRARATGGYSVCYTGRDEPYIVYKPSPGAPNEVMTECRQFLPLSSRRKDLGTVTCLGCIGA